MMDTGAGTIGGAADFTKAGDGWFNIFANTIRVEADTLKTNHETKRMDGGYYAPASNKPTAILPTRLTITGVINVNNDTLTQFLYKAQRSLGLKKLKGGVHLLKNHPSAVSGEVYIIVTSFKPSEALSDSVNTYGYTLQAEVIEL